MSPQPARRGPLYRNGPSGAAPFLLLIGTSVRVVRGVAEPRKASPPAPLFQFQTLEKTIWNSESVRGLLPPC
jgi:hypothetical protein